MLYSFVTLHICVSVILSAIYQPVSKPANPQASRPKDDKRLLRWMRILGVFLLRPFASQRADW